MAGILGVSAASRLFSLPNKELVIPSRPARGSEASGVLPVATHHSPLPPCYTPHGMGLSRILLYYKAYANLPDLDRRSAALLDDPREMVKATMNYCDGFLGPVQDVDELAKLLNDLKSLRPQTILEIGTHRGGTLFLWTRFAQPDATLISIDLPRGKFGGGYSPFRAPMYRRFARASQQVHLLRADSHAARTLTEARQLLAGRPLDFLFIDGDHTFDGAKSDWQMYSPLVRPAGLIVFHDIAGVYADTQVKSFWDSLKPQHSHREYIAHPNGKFGIGIVEYNR